MDRPKTHMSNRSVRASSSRTLRSSIEGADELVVGESVLNRPKTALTKFTYLTKKPKPVVSEEIVELPVCRPTTSARRTKIHSLPVAQPEIRPKTAPFPAKTWTQLVRDSSFHETSSQRKQSIAPYPRSAWEECPDEDEEYRIILLGKAGSGKSSTGNCILNGDYFGKSSLKCCYGTTDRFGKRISVVDTYDVFDKHSDKSLVSRELVKLVGMTSPGFHVVVLILAIGNITNKEHHAYHEFVRHFGNEVKKRTILLFTRRDILDSDGSTIYGYVSEVPKGIQEVMEQCKRRYLAFNNNATGREKDVQVRRLLDLIENILKQNGGRHFSSEVYGATKLIIKRRMDDIKSHLKEKLIREQDELEAQIRISQTPRSARSSNSLSDIMSPRNRIVKSKKSSSRRRKTKTGNENHDSEDHLTKLPNLNFKQKDNKKKDKFTRHKADDENMKSSRLRSTSKSDISVEDDDDFGDCDVVALKRRIEEDFDIPIMHLPSEDFVDWDERNECSIVNGDIHTDRRILELQKRYEEEISIQRLREKVREECEQEQGELFQMMWKLTRYFDQSLHLNNSPF